MSGLLDLHREDLQAILSHLSDKLIKQSCLTAALGQVANQSVLPARGQIYITRRPHSMDDPFFPECYQIGAKLTYFNKQREIRQFGQLASVSTLEGDMVSRIIALLAKQLAEHIVEYEKGPTLLPVQELTVQDRTELEAWL